MANEDSVQWVRSTDDEDRIILVARVSAVLELQITQKVPGPQKWNGYVWPYVNDWRHSGEHEIADGPMVEMDLFGDEEAAKATLVAQARGILRTTLAAIDDLK